MIGPRNQERRVIQYLIGIFAAVSFCAAPCQAGDRNIIHYVILPQPQQIIYQQPTPPALVVRNPASISQPPLMQMPTTPVYFPVMSAPHRPILNWCRT